MSGPDHIVEVVGATKTYGAGAHSTAALRDLSLHLRRGEFVSLMGPSGSGKSTLLNVIAGLDTLDSGRVIVDGHDLSRLADSQLADLRIRSIGIVFQAFNLLPALTVEENVSWPLEFSHKRRRDVGVEVESALGRVGMAQYARRFPSELSGGEQQRVAIARAIVAQPALILADEPTGNLDSHTGRLILDLLRSLNDTQGVTILMVTHNMFAATYGHRTIEMSDGRVVGEFASPPRDAKVTELARG